MASNPPHALRLTFAYRGAQITLAGSERVAMIVPAPLDTAPVAGQTGYWVALLDADGSLVYRRPLHSPIRVDVEAFSPGNVPSITRVPLAEPEGQFTVLVPDVANAQTFQLHGPADPARSDEPATELLRLDVDALRSSKPPTAPGRAAPPGPGGVAPPTGKKG